MPPPMPNPAKRMTANPAKPVGRYRPGKAIAEQESSDEDEEESEEDQQQRPSQKIPQTRPVPARPPALARQESEDEDEEGFVTESEDEDDGDGGVRISNAVPASKPPTVPKVSRTSVPVEHDTDPSEQGSEDDEVEEDDEDEDSSEEESSSEDEKSRRKFQRPTFVKKADRNLFSTTAPSNSNGVNPAVPPSSEVDEQTRRLAQAELLIKDKLERDALARAAGKKAWDDDDEVDPEDMVDDRDGQDPEAEYAAWKLRELKRLKRDREAIETREREIEELERRRNLTAEEREREDREFLDKQKEEREDGRGKANFLARYHHKGAFFQDDEAAEILKKRDIMGARFVDEVGDKSALPEYMRIRDMTKLGKKGRTRYTDLKGEDTGRFGDDVKRWRGSGGDDRGATAGSGFDMRGVDERFLPDRDREGSGPTGPTGANASTVGRRRDRRSRSPRRTDDEEEYRSRRRRSHSRSKSRSRSPQRRKRSSSPYRDREKRRRVDAM